jgi:protein-S-isoprenylcysteine O-methyltransferase Ste14
MVDAERLIAIFLASFYLFVAGFYISLIKIRQQKKQSKLLIHTGVRYSMHWWNHMSFRIFRAAILSVCLTRVFFPPIDAYLGMINLPNELLFNIVGICALVVGFTLAILSNFTLQSSWRSGIDNRHIELITSGLYSLSRNPGYIGVGLAQIGFFLALPSIFSLVCMLIGLNALRLQTQLEESFLSQVHPLRYQEYCQKTPKWV